MSSLDSPAYMGELATTGVDIERKVKGVIAEMTCYGAYCLLCGKAIYSIRRTNERSRRHWLLVAALLLTYVLITINCAGNITGTLYELHLLIENTQIPFPEVVKIYSHSSVGTFVLVVNLIVGRMGDTGLIVSSLKRLGISSTMVKLRNHLVSHNRCSGRMASGRSLALKVSSGNARFLSNIELRPLHTVICLLSPRKPLYAAEFPP
jgi:hypothetical protein